MPDSTLIRILLYIGPLSFLTVGGGQTVLGELHRQAVDIQGWMTDRDFLELFALSRMTPGPGTTMVTMMGWKADGLAGALVASLAIYFPASVTTLLLAGVWQRNRGALWQQAVERGLAPLAAGMIFATSLTLLQASEGGWLSWAVAIASAVILTVSRANPLLVMAGGAVVFFLVSLI